MGPGPSDVYPEVLAAMARPTIGHLDPAFVEFMDGLNELLRHENIILEPSLNTKPNAALAPWPLKNVAVDQVFQHFLPAAGVRRDVALL